MGEVLDAQADGGRVLLAEDVRVQLAALEQMLLAAHPDYEIITAATVEQALGCIADEEPFDVVLTDMRMPHGEEGLAVVEAARKKDRLTEIVVLTAYGDLDNVYKALERGATQYIAKDMRDFEQALLAVVRKRVSQVRQQRSLEGWIEEYAGVLPELKSQLDRIEELNRSLATIRAQLEEMQGPLAEVLDRLSTMLAGVQNEIEQILGKLEPLIETLRRLIGDTGDG